MAIKKPIDKKRDTGDYRYKLQLPNGRYLDERLKTDYLIEIGSVIEMDGTEYNVECVGRIKGILYKVVLKETGKVKYTAIIARLSLKEKVKSIIRRIKIWRS